MSNYNQRACEYMYPQFIKIFTDNASFETGEIDFDAARPDTHILSNEMRRYKVPAKLVEFAGDLAAQDVKAVIMGFSQIGPEDFSVHA